MAKKLIFACLLVLGCLQIFAEPVTVEKARLLATNILRTTRTDCGETRVPSHEVQLLYTRESMSTHSPLLYVFGTGEPTGFAIVSADNCAETLLGYSDQGTFDPNRIPCGLSCLLDGYARQIEEAVARGDAPIADGDSSGEEIPPMLTSRWAQFAPFNVLCPTDEATGQHHPAGCVAVAMAQLMYYHRWPEQGTGSSSYRWQGQTLSANYGETTYRWDLMHDDYACDAIDTDEAVATLVSHCGISVQMNYDTDYSSSYLSQAQVALATYFKYAGGAVKSRASGDNLESDIYESLLDGSPVLFAGNAKNTSHAFICDGYRNGFFHFNFGWDGLSDGYYKLSATLEYVESQKAYVGIFPPSKEQMVIIDGNTYSLLSKTKAVLLSATSKSSLTIPTQIEHDGNIYRVRVVAKEAFKDCAELDTLVIPEGIAIEPKTFVGATSLRCVTIGGAGETTIAAQAFDDSKLLEEVNIGSGVVEISNSCFLGKRNLHTVNLSEGLKTIGERVFQDCTQLENITIPRTVKKIDNSAFQNCTNLKEIHLSEGLSTIGISCFQGCTALKQISLPKGLVNLFGQCFQNCSRLTSIKIPQTVRAISNRTFQNCLALTEVVLSDSLTSIGDYAFALCQNLDNVRLPNTLTTIGMQAFANCTNLSEMIIPEGVEEIKANCFYGCKNLIKAKLPQSLRVIAPQAFQRCTNLRDVSLPQALTTLDLSAFAQCESLEHIILPETLTLIGQHCFSGCTALTEIVIADEVKELKAYCFFNCISLPKVYVNANKLGASVFSTCTALQTIYLGKDVRFLVENSIFANLPNLSDVYCFSSDVPYAKEATFKSTDIASVTLHVPLESTERYKNTTPWNLFRQIVPIEENEWTDIPQTTTSSAPPTAYYTPDGHQLHHPQRGINLVRREDGTTIKVIDK